MSLFNITFHLCCLTFRTEIFSPFALSSFSKLLVSVFRRSTSSWSNMSRSVFFLAWSGKCVKCGKCSKISWMKRIWWWWREIMRWMRKKEDGWDLVHNNDDNENVREEEVLNLMIIKIVIILMEVMWAKEDVLHLGHSGWQLGAQGAPSVSTQRLVRPGAASDLQEGTPIIYKNTHTILILGQEFPKPSWSGSNTIISMVLVNFTSIHHQRVCTSSTSPILSLLLHNRWPRPTRT